MTRSELDEDLPAKESPSLRRCSGCGRPNDRERAKYCRACGAEATRRWRASRRAQRPNATASPKPDLTEEEREIVRARAYVSTYVRRGKIAKTPCRSCGERQLGKIGPFHADPTKRKEFVWLCGPCAKQARSTARAVLRLRAVRSKKEEERFQRLSEGRDRGRAAMLLIRRLDPESRARVVAQIEAVFRLFHWPLRPHGYLYQDVARAVYEHAYGTIWPNDARAVLTAAGVGLFAETEQKDDDFFCEPFSLCVPTPHIVSGDRLPRPA